MRNYNISRSLSFACLLILLSGCRTTGSTAEEITPSPVQDLQNPQIIREEYRNPPHFAEVSDEPRQIALLLPLSGAHADAAKAIREGFLASYYNAKRNGVKPSVRIYDTTKDKDIQRLYDQAVADGADFVVGPLAKEDVLRLSMLSEHQLKAPVLALNHHPAIQASSKSFTQFTLAPESEVEQIADKAWQKGYRNASIVVPDNAWGQRAATAFTSRWQQFGGRVLQTVQTNPAQDQAAAVRRLLGIDQSQNRADHIKGLLTEKVDFQPRRRKDVDVIVMAAPPEQARQLKPLFDFYYAEDVPVYATSSIYSGSVNPKKENDLNGVVFCDMPWLLTQKQGANLRQLLSQSGSEQSDQYNRLFAMGADAYQLTSHMKALQYQPGASYPGATGTLSLGNNNIIQRKLAWAKISNGLPYEVQ